MSLPVSEPPARELDPRLLAWLDQFTRRTGKPRAELRLLDFGCGRGGTVQKLRALGYANACGVDVNPTEIEAAKERGPQEAFELLDASGTSSFPSAHFDCVFSEQVLEHVPCLPTVVNELQRLTRPGGAGRHTFPAKRGVVENHLEVPFVHWLPKTRVRRAYLLWYARLRGLTGPTARTEDTPESWSKRQAEYTIERTFYRSATAVRRTFLQAGFRAEFEPINLVPGLSRLPLFGAAAGSEPVQALSSWYARTFREVLLLTERR